MYSRCHCPIQAGQGAVHTSTQVMFVSKHVTPDLLKYLKQKSCKNNSIKKERDRAAPLFKELEILPLGELIKLKRGSFMWKLDNNLVESYIPLFSYFN